MAPREHTLWFAFRAGELLVRAEGDRMQVPASHEWQLLGLPAEGAHRVASAEGLAGYTMELPASFEPPAHHVFAGLRRLWTMLDEGVWRLAGRAVQIVAWDRDHRYCGRCGGETLRTPGQLERSCPRCGLAHYPRLAPAVIVRVTDGDRILLARSSRLPTGMYSTLAGFVEPGETLEETVAREVREEVGIEVRNLRYFGSQPWPFPNSLMIGFTADYAGGELRLQESEIADAGWYTAGALPQIPPRISIARALIDDFLVHPRS
jgi:NAD+ diphosphatase